MPDRSLTPCDERAGPLAVDGGPVRWLERTAAECGLEFLLAFADDGVVWGRVVDGRLTTAHDRGVGPPLRAVTLQEARLFGEAGEVLLWRSGPAFSARAIRPAGDGEPPSWDRAFDERHLLWGDRAEPVGGGFTRLREGAQGLIHAPPLGGGLEVALPAALRVRHYVTYAPGGSSSAGLARVAASRLVGLVTT